MADEPQDEKQEDSKESKVTETAEEAVEEVKEPVEETKVEPQETAAPEPEPIKAEFKEEIKAPPKPVSPNLEKIIEQIEKLSVLELADLVHALEDRFGVSAQAPVATASASTKDGGSEPVEEKTTFNVILTASGANKISAIKAVRELVPTLGLKEAKDLVEAAPKPVLESVNKTTAEEAKIKLTAAGATVELQ